jgi:hypothetical protein
MDFASFFDIFSAARADTTGAFFCAGLMVSACFSEVVFEAATFVTEGWYAAGVFEVAGVLAGSDFAVDPAGPVVPAAGLDTLLSGVLPAGLSDSLFILTSSMISKN